MTLRMLALAVVLAPALAVACPRPPAFPPRLPLTPCPTSATLVRGAVVATYAEPVERAGDAFADALTTDGWDVQRTAVLFSEVPHPGDTVLRIAATKGSARLTAAVIVAARDRTRIRIALR